ncbi:MAG TPA: hypothetical protein VFK15_07900 [Burkholderiales bacterium]|jgi:hypothetical protein|nr:hypothetical protein [Burkholderiales bacterium]
MERIRAPSCTDELHSLHLLATVARERRHAAISPALIPPEQRARLLACGYAILSRGELAITPVGQAKIVCETTRADWFPSRR